MLVVQLFAADKEKSLGYVPLSKKLSQYEDAIRYVKTKLREDYARDKAAGTVDEAEEERDSHILNAKLIGMAARFERGHRDAETCTELHRLVLTAVLTDWGIQEQWHACASDHIIQMALPAAPQDEPVLQWMKPDDELTRDMVEMFAEDEQISREYREQAQEVASRLQDPELA